MQKTVRSILIGFWVLFFLAGCGLFPAKKEKPILPVYAMSFNIHPIWSKSLGNGAGNLDLLLEPTLFKDVLFTAHQEGRVVGVDVANGQEIVVYDFGQPLSTGPLVSKERVVAGSLKGELLSLSREKQHIEWRVPLLSELLASPQKNDDKIAILPSNGALTLFHEDSGRMVWEAPVEAAVFSLRGSSKAIFADDKILAGFANGKLKVFSAANGRLLWERRISLYTGDSELGRLIDVDSNVLVVGNTVYAVGYQGDLIACDLNTGNTLWERKLSSFSGLTQWDSLLLATDEVGHVFAFDLHSGAVRWENKSLAGRILTAPVVLQNALLLSDETGILFAFSKEGKLLAHFDTTEIGTNLILPYQKDSFFVVSQSGEVGRYQLGPIVGGVKK